MFNALYLKTLKLAGHKKSKFFLALVAFTESSFFPIPPDIMIVPMVISKKKDYFQIFLITTFASAIGGLLGYFIGASFLDLSMNLIQFYGYEEEMLKLKNDLSSGKGFFIFLGTLFLAGFTPLPFKIFTITSGLISFNILIFFLVCLISRGFRFFIVSYLTYKFGDTFNKFIQEQKSKKFILFLLIVVSIAIGIYFYY